MIFSSGDSEAVFFERHLIIEPSTSPPSHALIQGPTIASQDLFRGLRPEAGNAGSRGDLSHILSFVAHTCARLSPLQKLDLLKKREREREMYIYIYII